MDVDRIVVEWVHHNIDVIRYLAVVVGFIYSYYHRVIVDRREDKIDTMKNDYIDKLANDLKETVLLKETLLREKETLVKTNRQLETENQLLISALESPQCDGSTNDFPLNNKDVK